MALRAASRREQRGAALLAMVAIVVMGVSYMLVDRLHAASRFIAVDRDHNAKVLSRAKRALVGYVLQQAALAGENNPGRLPCPEAGAYFGDPAQEGIAAPNCTLPAVGRLPWRTLGLDKLVDADAEPLWYVVSPGWALSNSTVPPLRTLINLDSVGQLTVDGVANDAIALIISPGATMAVEAGAGCTALAQARAATGAPDLRNYLECDNATSPADATFATSAPGRTFNDQVLRVAAADLIPGLEPVMAHRAEREIAPVLKTVYTSSQYAGIPGPSPLYPYAAPFGNPGPGSGTSNYVGATGVYQGLLPFNQIQGCSASASNPRCQPSLVAYASTPADAVETLGYGNINFQSCFWESTNEIRVCEGEYEEDGSEPWRPIRIQMTATFTNVAMGLRALDGTRMQVFARDNTGSPPWTPLARDYTSTMNDGSISGRPRGSVTMQFSALMPNIDTMGWETRASFRIRIERAVISDHALLDTANATVGWFVRNEWYRVFYFAAAQRNTADGLPSSFGCSNGSDCLRMNFPTASSDIRSLIIFAGRSLSGMARPNSVIDDYLEFQNKDGDVIYEQRPISKVVNAALMWPFNDHVMVVDRN